MNNLPPNKTKMISEQKSYRRVCKENLFDFVHQNVIIVGKPLQQRDNVLQISLGENGTHNLSSDSERDGISAQRTVGIR